MENKIIYRVKDWNTHFENSHSRKCKRLHWVRIPTQHDGKSFRRVMGHERSAEVFAAWILIVQVASKCEPRGVLIDGETPLDAEDMSLKTGLNKEAFEVAFEALTNERIGWLEAISLNTEEIPV